MYDAYNADFRYQVNQAFSVWVSVIDFTECQS